MTLRKEKAPNEPNPNSEHGLDIDEPPVAAEPARKPTEFALDPFQPIPVPRSGSGRS